MFKYKGNVVIVILLIIVISSIVFLINLKYKQLNKSQSKAVAPTAQQEHPLPEKPIQNITLHADEILNPFSSNPSVNIVPIPTQNRAPQPPDTAQQRPLNEDKSDLPNLTPKKVKNEQTRLPNGQPIPLVDGHISNYPVKYNNGRINITVKNEMLTSNLVVYLYHLNHLNGSKETFRPDLASISLISSGNTFVFKNMQSGQYQLKWLLLSNNTAYENKPFEIYQDNKYIYDRVFTFGDTNNPNQEKASKISTSTLP